MAKETWRLPTGAFTTSVDEYVEAWRDLGRPLAELLGGQLYAFDPYLAIRGDGWSFDFPVHVARIVKQELLRVQHMKDRLRKLRVEIAEAYCHTQDKLPNNEWRMLDKWADQLGKIINNEE